MMGHDHRRKRPSSTVASPLPTGWTDADPVPNPPPAETLGRQGESDDRRERVHPVPLLRVWDRGQGGLASCAHPRSGQNRDTFGTGDTEPPCPHHWVRILTYDKCTRCGELRVHRPASTTTRRVT